ncbi:helix-turn-helix transcriptional regulator [uncultured Ferrimonas sp.]|uniref:AraC family transcriptional regulator n=1 Tax=uncultured Ferrimonas sp. TaxID=432640 RepID=UPI00262097C3|nr:helix-turn-helix transcriptional regulator [uncultured Ferrimonas sp.]
MNIPVKQHENNPNPLYCHQYRSDPNIYVDFHTHKTGQLLYLAEGSAIIETPDVQTRISPDRGIWLPPHTPHNTRASRSYLYRSIYIDTKVYRGLPEQVCIKQIGPLLQQLIDNCSDWQQSWERNSIHDYKARVIVDEIINSSSAPLSVSHCTERRLAIICQQLIENPENKMSLAGWGIEVGASEKTLARLFKKEMGVNFHQWRLSVRMMHAVTLLKQGIAIAEIIPQVGYGSASAFNSAFQSYFGKKPTEYK